MLRLLKQPHHCVKEFKSVSYTYDTLGFFEQKYPHHFSWVMGSEYLPKFDDFLALHPKLIEYDFYIYPRAGYPMSPLKTNMRPVTGVKEIDISSTLVRQRVKEGKSIDTLVLPQVKDYIATNHLYA